MIGASRRSIGGAPPLIAIAVGVIGLATWAPRLSVGAQAGTSVGPSPTVAYTEPSETTPVYIHIADVEDLYGADVRLSYDPDVIEIVDALPAGGIQVQPLSSFMSPDLVLFNTVDPDAGTIWYAATQISPTLEVSGSGVIASFEVRGLEAGTSPLEVTYQKLVRRDGTTITATPVDGVVHVGPPAPVLSIDDVDEETARLSWTASPGASSYEVHRGTSLPFTADGSPLATVSDLDYDDADALGSAEINHVYSVRAKSDSGLRSPPSNLVAEFEYELMSSDVPGERLYNLVGLPIEEDDVSSADTLADHVGAGVYNVLRHDAVSQGIEYWLPGLGIGTDFELSNPATAFLGLDSWAPELLSLTGGVPEIGTESIALARPTGGGSCKHNFINVSLHRTDLTTAEELGADIGGVYMMLRFDVSTQSVEWRVLGLAGPNFPVRAGYPYVACLTATGPATWPN